MFFDTKFLKLFERVEFLNKKRLFIGVTVSVEQNFKAQSLCPDSYYHAIVTERIVCPFLMAPIIIFTANKEIN